MISGGGRHTATSDIWLTSLKKKKNSVSVNKILVYGLQHSSEKAEFGKEKKKKNEKVAQNCDSFAVECEQTIS